MARQRWQPPSDSHCATRRQRVSHLSVWGRKGRNDAHPNDPIFDLTSRDPPRSSSTARKTPITGYNSKGSRKQASHKRRDASFSHQDANQPPSNQCYSQPQDASPDLQDDCFGRSHSSFHRSLPFLHGVQSAQPPLGYPPGEPPGDSYQGWWSLAWLGGIPSSSRYLATVRRAMVIPRAWRHCFSC